MAYIEAKPVRQIAFCDFTLFKEHPEFYSTYKLINVRDTNQVYTEKFVISSVNLMRPDLATEDDKLKKDGSEWTNGKGSDITGLTPDTYYVRTKASGTALASTNQTLTVAPTYSVIYKVVGGTWSDGSTTDKTETVHSGSKPAGVPTGMIASSGYTGGAWNTNPSEATITGATTFTYTFTEKPGTTVTKAPEAKDLFINKS